MRLSPRVHRLRAPNPSPMTLTGTNGYILDAGDGTALVIDPGPAIESHVRDFSLALETLRLKLGAILVTHGHPDHYPAAASLKDATGAGVAAHYAARFAHDRKLREGERLRFGTAGLTVLEAPGHAADHLVFFLEDEAALFTGDVVIGEGTVVIAPPGGSMRAYQATLARLRAEYGGAAHIYGGHGPEIGDVRAKLDEYIAHRERREREIVDALQTGPKTIPAIVEIVYARIDRVLWPAAARQVLAYLIALCDEGALSAHVLTRPPTAGEATILHFDFGRIADAASAELAAAELGLTGAAEPLEEYALTGAMEG